VEKNENEVEHPVSNGLDRLRTDIMGSVADFPATVRCAMCTKWFCEADAEDAQWHP